jgi:hypothetical protein
MEENNRGRRGTLNKEINDLFVLNKIRKKYDN